MAYPYGNSQYVPVDLRYFAGGANSLRGWSARSLGPGSMPRSASQSIFDQVGDIKLEMNAEYRMKILGSLQLSPSSLTQGISGRYAPIRISRRETSSGTASTRRSPCQVGWGCAGTLTTSSFALMWGLSSMTRRWRMGVLGSSPTKSQSSYLPLILPLATPSNS